MKLIYFFIFCVTLLNTTLIYAKDFDCEVKITGTHELVRETKVDTVQAKNEETPKEQMYPNFAFTTHPLFISLIQDQQNNTLRLKVYKIKIKQTPEKIIDAKYPIDSPIIELEKLALSLKYSIRCVSAVEDVMSTSGSTTLN
jgi:hypothetical protein